MTIATTAPAAKAPYPLTSKSASSDAVAVLRRVQRFLAAASSDWQRTMPTGRNLIRDLHENFGVRLSETYGTNHFPFIKRGGIDQQVFHWVLMTAHQQLGDRLRRYRAACAQ
jgi:hypothetical protein